MTMTTDQRAELIQRLSRGEELSSDWERILFPPERREYELVYDGKQREEDIISETMAVPLQAVRTFNQSDGEGQNKLIFGDNLQVMKRLLELKRAGGLKNPDGTSGIKLVYIDPPFATMKDFSGADEERAYADKIRGAEFLEFLRRRLVLIRELLTDDGAIYLHLDQKKVHYVKVLMDEIFGEGRLRNEIIWHYRFRMMDSVRKFNKKHDTILFSTIDNNVYGAGDKTVHNVLGGFGVVRGNGGDLCVGLPRQSLFCDDGTPHHVPQRLLTIVQAPLDRVDAIILEDALLGRLFGNGWVKLVVIDPTNGRVSRWTAGDELIRFSDAPGGWAEPRTIV